MTTLVVDTMVTGVVRKLMAERDELKLEVERLLQNHKIADLMGLEIANLRDELADANAVVKRLELMRDKLLGDRVGLRLEVEKMKSERDEWRTEYQITKIRRDEVRAELERARKGIADMREAAAVKVRTQGGLCMEPGDCIALQEAIRAIKVPREEETK